MTDDSRHSADEPVRDGAGGTAIPDKGGAGWLGVEHQEQAPAAPGGTTIPTDGGKEWLGKPDDRVDEPAD